MRLLGLPLFWVVATTAVGAAAEPRERGGDRYDLAVRAETHASLFQRALLPGPEGAIVSTRTVVPLYEYVSLRADDLDTPFAKDSVDFELSGWGSRLLGQRGNEPGFDGDLQTAFVRYHQGPIAVRLGRQNVAGGAARFSRFDGAELTAALGAGTSVEAYGGFSVLPRWNHRATYQYLGAVPEVALRNPEAFGTTDRSHYWLAGGRLGWAAEMAAAGLSFHEQREDRGLSRRELGADGRITLAPSTRLGATALMELDRLALADLRGFLDLSPVKELALTFDVVHTEPALLLSHASVLSVFSTDSYDELGGTVAFEAARWLRLDAAGYEELYTDASPGSRGELAARVLADRAHRTFLRVSYTRFVAPSNGYFALRTSLSREFSRALLATLDAYGYFYDRPIHGYRTSSVGTGALTVRATPALSITWGSSLASSPYARLDAQTLLDLALDLDLGTRGRRP